MGTENVETLVEPTDSSMAVAMSSGSRAGRARILRWIVVFECHESLVGLLFVNVRNCSMEFLYRRNVMAYGVPNSFQWCNLGSFLIRQVVIDVQGKSVSWLQKCRGQVRLQDFPCSLCVPQLPENSPQHYLIFMCLGFSDRMLNISYDYTLCIQISIWIP